MTPASYGSQGSDIKTLSILRRHEINNISTTTGLWGLWGENVDAINYYTSEIENLDKKARAERERILGDTQAEMPAAFVSFKTRWGAAVCAQTQQNRNPTKWLTDWAPEPRDVYWRNLAIPYMSLTARKVTITAATVALSLFCMIPILAIQSLANLDGIEKRAKFLKPIINQPFIKSLLQGFLPGLALRIFLLVLPYILMAMSKFEGHLSYSTLDTKSAAKLYNFMVINVFFGSVITGSLVEQVNSILSHSSVTDVLKNLGSSIPMKATFFITYIMVDGWSGVSAELFRLVPLIIYHIRNLFFVKTLKDRDHAMAPGNVMFDTALPHLELYFLLGIVYSVITPIIMPFIILFFAFGYLVHRHLVINVYDPTYDSAGAFWPHVHARIITGMVIEQLMLIGIFTIKGPIGFVNDDNLTGARHKALHYIREICSSTPFMITLPVLTLIFHYYCKKRFDSAFLNYPLEEAMAKDREELKATPNLNLRKYLQHSYLHPVLKDEDDDMILLEQNRSPNHEEDIINVDDEALSLELSPLESLETAKSLPLELCSIPGHDPIFISDVIPVDNDSPSMGGSS